MVSPPKFWASPALIASCPILSLALSGFFTSLPDKMAVNFVQGLLSRSSKGKIPLNLFDKSLFLSSFHTTNATYRGKRKVKVLKPPRLVQMIENGASDEEVQNFINMRDAKRKVTAAYKSKMEEVAELFREQFRIEEERKKDIQGEQMRKEAEEKEQAARNLAIILKSNEELQRERYPQSFQAGQCSAVGC